MIGFEVFPDALGEDEWEPLDVLEAFVAQRLDGLAVTSGGVYDQNLQVLLAR